MKRFAVPVVLGALAMAAVSSRASAQYVFLGGGPSIPVGEFSDYAKSGWLLQGGIGVDVGKKGFWLEAEGFFGSNSHEDTGNLKEKTNLIGFMGAIGKTLSPGKKVSPYVLAGAGILGHQFRTDDDNAEDLEATENKFAYTGALGLSIALNTKARFWVEGRYIGSSGTAVIPVMVGISITLGGGSAGM